MLKEFAQYLQQLLTQNVNLGDSVAALPENLKVVDLERYQPRRRRFRGKLNTHLITAFEDYHDQHEALQGTCFINPEKMQAISYFDLGDSDTPGHCDHSAILTLKKTAELRALEDFLCRMPVGQKALAEFLEEFRTYITASEDSGADMEIAKVIQAVRKIEMNATSQQSSQIGNFDATVSAMERIELQGQRLPAFIGFTCKPYFGLPARTFTMRLSLISGETPKLSLRQIAPELDQQAMADEFQQLLIEQLPEATTIHLGTFEP